MFNLFRLLQQAYKSTYNIVILEQNVYPVAENIRISFMLSLNNYKPPKTYPQKTSLYDFHLFNAIGKPEQLINYADQITNGQYDLILTIGTDCTHETYQAALRKRCYTPIVFCNIKNVLQELNFKCPITTELIHENQIMTGVLKMGYHHDDQATILCRLMPKTKKAFLIYDPIVEQGILEQDRKRMLKILDEHRIALFSIRVQNQATIRSQLYQALQAQKPDVLLTMYDPTTMSYIRDISDFANKYQIPLYAGDLESVNHGAALGYGSAEEMMGIESSYKAFHILNNRVSPTQIPITFLPEDRHLRASKHNMHLQGLKLDQQTIIKEKIELV